MTTTETVYWCTDANMSEEWNYEHLISPDEVSMALGYFDNLLVGKEDVAGELSNISSILATATMGKYAIPATPEYDLRVISRFAKLWDYYTEHFNVVPEPVTPKQAEKVASIKRHLTDVRSELEKVKSLLNLYYPKPYENMVDGIREVVAKIVI